MSSPRRTNAQTQGIDGSLNLDEEIFSGDDQPTHITPPDVPVSVVIPARNEARNLAYVFSRLPVGLHQVILVDGHSTDGTIREALRLRPEIEVIEQTGRGKGDALNLGFAACTGDVIVMIDADGSTDPREIPRFVAALYSGADFVKARATRKAAGAATSRRHASSATRSCAGS